MHGAVAGILPKKDGKDRMAEYHLHAKTHSRGAGKGAGGHVRYILRQGPYSKRTVEVVDGATVQRVEESRADEVVFEKSAHLPAWVEDDPLAYWDAADAYERANGTVYREIEFALPAELPEPDNLALAQAFAEALARVEGGATPYTLAIHKSEKDPALLHCHLMLSDKVDDGHDRSPELWFRRAANRGKDPATGGAPKTQARIAKDWLGESVRPLWADLANRALERAGIAARIDHRSLDAQRREQELLAEQAREKGDELAAARHNKAAAALDRPPQPKKGRVLEHSGPERASGQAQAWERHLAALAERQAALEAIETAERESERLRAELEQAQERRQTVQERWTERQRERAEREIRRRKLRDLVDLLRTDQEAKANLRAAYAAAGYRLEERDGKRVWVYPHGDLRAERDAVVTARKAWTGRKQERVLDASAREERRNGMRAAEPEPSNPARPSWAAYRERVLTEAYGQEVGLVLGKWVRVDLDRSARSLHIHNKAMDLTDYGDRIVAGLGGTDREIEAMLQIVGAKGWKALTLTGSEDFRMRAGAAALAAGFDLTDGDLAARIAAQQKAEADLEKARADIEAERVAREREQERIRHEAKQASDARLTNWRETGYLIDADAKERGHIPWGEWREKTMTERYGPKMAARAEAEAWYTRMRADLGGLDISHNGQEVVDAGAAMQVCSTGSMPLAVELVRAKGWRRVVIGGPDPFQERVARALVEAGIPISNAALEQGAREAIERERRGRAEGVQRHEITLPNEAADAARARSQGQAKKKTRGPDLEW